MKCVWEWAFGELGRSRDGGGIFGIFFQELRYYARISDNNSEMVSRLRIKIDGVSLVFLIPPALKRCMYILHDS